MSFQYLNSNKFLSGTEPAPNFLDNFNSKYLYTRLAFGVTRNLTMSVETGYFLNRTQIGLNAREEITSSGFGDLILFPRYTVYTHNTEETRTEVTVGLGLKIPIGKHLDSTVVYTDPTGRQFFTPMPPAVMPTTGSNDFIFYGFAYRGYPNRNYRVFANALYIRKGWNSLGQRFGDYAGVGLYAGKTFFRNLGTTMGVKGEWIDKMEHDPEIDMLATYNLDISSTGGKQILLVPQVSYTIRNLSLFVLTEIPLYQYVNGTAIASQYLLTGGFSYRFFAKKQNG